MIEVRAGLSPVSDELFELAHEVAGLLTGHAHVLTGLTLADARSGARATVDLVIITDTAVVVAIDSSHPALVAPREAGLLVVQVQQRLRRDAPLPAYPCWLGESVPAGTADRSAALNGPAALHRFVLRAGEQGAYSDAGLAASLADLLLEADQGPLAGTRRVGSARGIRKVLRELTDLPARVDAGLQEQIRQPLALGRAEPVRPADVSRRLQEAMLARENLLEDVNYGKIVPNDYIVELNQENVERHYRPIEGEVCRQWQEKLLEALNTANGRQGRREYRFGGPVRVRIRPSAALAPGEVRVFGRIKADGDPDARGNRTACLELLDGGRRWPLRPGTVTLGRDAGAAIHFDRPDVQERRLVSSQHAYVVCDRGGCRLFDGSSDGRPSVNGTFVNGQPVPAGGRALTDGDLIVLAALDPEEPRPDRPGVVGLYFREDC